MGIKAKPVRILDTSSLLESLEIAALENGVEPETLYYQSGLDPRTRARWKAGIFVPRLSTLQHVQDTLNEIILFQVSEGE